MDLPLDNITKPTLKKLVIVIANDKPLVVEEVE